MRCYFPLDTGALAAGRLGELIKDFRTALRMNITKNSTPWHFLSSVYGTAERYFSGDPLPRVRLDLPLSVNSAISEITVSARSDVDYRRFSLECHATEDVSLDQYLKELWIPSERATELRKLPAPPGVRYQIYNDGNCPQFLTL